MSEREKTKYKRDCTSSSQKLSRTLFTSLFITAVMTARIRPVRVLSVISRHQRQARTHGVCQGSTHSSTSLGRLCLNRFCGKIGQFSTKRLRTRCLPHAPHCVLDAVQASEKDWALEGVEVGLLWQAAGGGGGGRSIADMRAYVGTCRCRAMIGGIGYPHTWAGLARSGCGRHCECPWRRKQGRKRSSRYAGLTDPQRFSGSDE